MRRPPPCLCDLASRADRLVLALLLDFQRPLEQGRGCGLGLAGVALRLEGLLAQEKSDCCAVGAAVDRAIGYVGLSDVQGRALGTYSRGMRQRMRLARVPRPDEAARIRGKDGARVVAHSGGGGDGC